VGQRIMKQVGSGNTEAYVIDGRTALGVVTVNGSGTPTAWYFNLLAGDRVIGRQPNVGSRSYYHTDLLGSTRAVVQGASVVESYDFEPWGLAMPGRTLGSGTKEGFTSKEQDTETGLDYFGARYYMPALGRWASVDPPGGEFPEWSPYNYVKNDPIGRTDPFGLMACDPPGSCKAQWIASGSAIGAGVGVATATGCTVGTGGICAAGALPIVTAGAGLGAAVGGFLGTAYEMAPADALPTSVEMGKISRNVAKWILIGLGAINPAGPKAVPLDVRKVNRRGSPDVEQESKPEQKKDRGGAGGEPPKKNEEPKPKS
jgi:RHS repeat-associated protein